MSGKGGVGKSLTTSLISSEMNKLGYKVGILDADITGPSIPKGFGVKGPAFASTQGTLPNETESGIKIMSTNIILDKETDAVLWRAPVINNMIKTFWRDIVWGEVDYMFVDMPPGTGDVQLTVFQSIPIDGIIVVTSPQNLVNMIVEKSINMAKKMAIPVVGIVENMSYFKCPDCGKESKVFGDSKIEELVEKFGTKLLAKMPIDPGLSDLVDLGKVETYDASEILKGAIELLK